MGGALSYVFNNVFVIYYYGHRFSAQIARNLAIEEDMHTSVEGVSSNSWVGFQRHSPPCYMHKNACNASFWILAKSWKAVNNRLCPHFLGTIMWLILCKRNCRIKDCRILWVLSCTCKIRFSPAFPASLGLSSSLKIHVIHIMNKLNWGHSLINFGMVCSSTFLLLVLW